MDRINIIPGCENPTMWSTFDVAKCSNNPITSHIFNHYNLVSTLTSSKGFPE